MKKKSTLTVEPQKMPSKTRHTKSRIAHDGGKASERLLRDIFIITISVAVAFLLARSSVIEQSVLGFAQTIATLAGSTVIITEMGYALAAFLAGIFFTSAFTIAPAAVVLASLAQHGNMWLVAAAGAIGAMIGDFILFYFIRDVFAVDLQTALRRLHWARHTAWLHGHVMRICAPIIGALIIASPLPDELGLALMGFSRMKARYLVPIALSMNFLGILLITFIAHLV